MELKARKKFMIRSYVLDAYMYVHMYIHMQVGRYIRLPSIRQHQHQKGMYVYRRL